MKLNDILVATDFSVSSQAAMECASTIAHETGAKLFIVHVGDLLAHGVAHNESGSGSSGAPPNTCDWQATRSKLHAISPTVANVRFEHRYLEGGPADEIVDFARRHKIDLIVIGTHGRTGFSRLHLGSIAEAVVRRADCPVLTVKAPFADTESPLGERTVIASAP